MNAQKLVVKRIPYGRLLKSEVSELAKKTIGIVENHNPETLLLEAMLNKLSALLPQIGIMSFSYGIDPKIQKVQIEKSKLMLNISKLKLEVRLLEKSGIDDELTLVKTFINGNLRNLHTSKNDKVLTQKVQGFIEALETEEKLVDAIESKGLIVLTDGIKLALREYQAVLAQRVTLLAERPKYNTPLIVSSVVEALENLLITIEAYHMNNTELDYTALIEELNQQAYMFRRSISIRLANNRRRAEAKKNGETDIDGDIDGDTNSDGSDIPIEDNAPETTSHRAFGIMDDEDEALMVND